MPPRRVSVMNDEFARLKSALRATMPEVPESVREQAVSAAMTEFDRHHQGRGDGVRHSGKGTKTNLTILRRLVMSILKPSPLLAGSAAVVAVAGLILYQMPLPLPDEEVWPALQTQTAQRSMSESQEILPDEAGSTMQSSMPASSVRHRQAQSTGEQYLSSWYISGQDQDGDRFPSVSSNAVMAVAEEPVSTFSIDVDTASYAYVRTSLQDTRIPRPEAVRIEELVNYFDYGYAPPEGRNPPFATHVSLVPSPWNKSAKLMHVGIKGYELDRSAMPRANLVFLIDTSGSMDEPNKLPLLIRSFRLLLTALAPDDRVAIVTYAGSAGVVLEPTPVSDRARILASLDDLYPQGMTAGAEGIHAAYRLAEQHRIDGGVNRVILATDGDFNVGITDPDDLERFIAGKRSSGVSLSVLGFGMGNYNDELMQRLAQNGNGNAAYIDTLSEARKVLLEQVASTLVTIAKDVKIQVEFNPATVREYRLIGCETRILEREDFNNDRIDAGEVGAGHAVTAIYEIVPADSDGGLISPLRYRETEAKTESAFTNEFAFLRIRYKLPDSNTSALHTRPVTEDDTYRTMSDAPVHVRFSVAVAAFGQLLKGGRHTGSFGHEDIIRLARDARGTDPSGYRSEFIRLVDLARTIEKSEQ